MRVPFFLLFGFMMGEGLKATTGGSSGCIGLGCRDLGFRGEGFRV